MKNVIYVLLLVALVSGCATTRTAESRRQTFQGTVGTYDGEPRLPNGHVDIDKLLAELKELRVNTYSWLIWHAATDWDDLHKFLPLARQNNINVWVTVVPPAESPPHTQRYSEPFRLNYDQWAEEIAKLSATERNLVAWNVDDFWYSRSVFTPEKLRGMLEITRRHNPRLAFIPCVYYQNATAGFANAYKGLFDGILFPYMAESHGGNLREAGYVDVEVKRFKEVFGQTMPVVVDIYATPHNKHRKDGPSVEYLRDTTIAAHNSADGVMIYCHQRKDLVPDRFNVLKEQFNSWAAAPSTPAN